jgi:hypothetical protein
MDVSVLPESDDSTSSIWCGTGFSQLQIGVNVFAIL